MKLTSLLVAAGMTFLGGHFAWAALSDGEIAEIMEVANDAEIDMAKAAKSKSESGAIKDYAEHMINEHKKNMKDGKKVTKDADIKTKSNGDAKTLKENSKSKISDMKKKKGPDFDRAYIDSQVEMHQQMLTDLNEKFIPQAQNPEYRNFLTTTKTHVEQHLAKAKEIQATLNR